MPSQRQKHQKCSFLLTPTSPLSPPGERLFPPPSGLTYSTWFCVERFSTAPQAHPVRLLTVVRRATSSEQHYVCLAVVLSAKDRSLTVSTKEELLQTYCETSTGFFTLNGVQIISVAQFSYRRGHSGDPAVSLCSLTYLTYDLSMAFEWSSAYCQF